MTKKDFKNHFGKDDNNSKNVIKNRIQNSLKAIGNLLQNDNYKTKVMAIDIDEYGQTNAFDLGHTVILGNYFWTANMLGQDSQMGIMVHEIFHFADVGYTRDFGLIYYGKSGSQYLINNYPNAALWHADTFEYYIER